MSQRILQNSEYIDRLSSDISNAKHSILVVSAFLRSEALEWLLSVLPGGVEVNLVTRWRKSDILSGASDFEAYEIAHKHRWGFHIDTDLHAKAVLLDRRVLFLGSANLTARGIHLAGYGNNELNIMIAPSDEEVRKIECYISNSYRLTMPMFMEMKECLHDEDHKNTKTSDVWPKEIAECLELGVNGLWVEECILSTVDEYRNSPQSRNAVHDRQLFGGMDEQGEFLKRLKIIIWLDSLLKGSEKECISFGYITSKLHDLIVTDPKPYRSEIKQLVNNIFDWICEYKIFGAVQFEHTRAIRNPYYIV